MHFYLGSFCALNCNADQNSSAEKKHIPVNYFNNTTSSSFTNVSGKRQIHLWRLTITHDVTVLSS